MQTRDLTSGGFLGLILLAVVVVVAIRACRAGGSVEEGVGSAGQAA